MPDPEAPDAEPEATAALAAAVLDEELRRAEAVVQPDVVLADNELPGVDDPAMSLRDALRVGGSRTIVIVGVLGALALVDNGIFNVL
ncbi:MAG TPA: hypothetical protein VFX21_09715, partial [Acidimicrobiia bacterium]|nr:hypothetical protein [Acidimicrobiia bacterium]